MPMSGCERLDVFWSSRYRGWSGTTVALRGYGRVMTNVPSTGGGRTDFGPFFADMFAITDSIRYVAVGRGQEIAMQQKAGLGVASGDVSNRFEELLVNPTLLTLTTQRGDLDCGGLRHLIIGYGYFNAYVLPIPGGHVCVSFELDSDPVASDDAIRQAIQRHLA
jgi:hypothetical protein